MIEVMRSPGATPTVAFAEALAPFRALLAPLKFGMVLRVVPRATGAMAPPVPADSWYDLMWSVPALCHHPDNLQPTCPDDVILDDVEPYIHVGWHDVAQAGTLPAPPTIPVERRLAAMPPVTEDDVAAWETRQPGVTKFLGGSAQVLAELRRSRVAAVAQDRTAAAYDWTAYVSDFVLPHYRSLTPPKLSPADRLWSAGARIWRAEQEIRDARTSAAHLLRNAHEAVVNSGGKPPKTQWSHRLGVSRPTIDAWLTAR